MRGTNATTSVLSRPPKRKKTLTYVDDYPLAVVVVVWDWMEVVLASVLRVLMDPLILVSIDLR